MDKRFVITYFDWREDAECEMIAHTQEEVDLIVEDLEQDGYEHIKVNQIRV